MRIYFPEPTDFLTDAAFAALECDMAAIAAAYRRAMAALESEGVDISSDDRRAENIRREREAAEDRAKRQRYGIELYTRLSATRNL